MSQATLYQVVYWPNLVVFKGTYTECNDYALRNFSHSIDTPIWIDAQEAVLVAERIKQ